MSTGEALRDQPLYIGIYTRQAELYNGEAVYVKVIISLQLLFISSQYLFKL